MLQGWRWYGPNDPVSLDDVRQAGRDRYRDGAASGADRRGLDARGGRGAQEPDRERPARPLAADLVGGGIDSDPRRRQAARGQGDTARSRPGSRAWRRWPPAGIKIICYNFMPVVDWCRTDLEWELPNGATRDALRPGPVRRVRSAYPEAARRRAEYSRGSAARAKALFRRDEPGRYRLSRHGHRQRAAGLDHRAADHPAVPRPAASNIATSRRKCCASISIEFLARVTPVAESLGVTLTLHPDDPPRPLFGLPRIASTADDYRRCSMPCRRRPTASASAPARSACAPRTICPRWRGASRRASRFAHLRATKREADGLSFFESDHLDGDVDMIAVLQGAACRKTAALAGEQDRVPARSRPSHARRSRRDQAHQSRLYRDRPPARPRRIARRDPRHRAHAADSTRSSVSAGQPRTSPAARELSVGEADPRNTPTSELLPDVAIEDRRNLK